MRTSSSIYQQTLSARPFELLHIRIVCSKLSACIRLLYMRLNWMSTVNMFGGESQSRTEIFRSAGLQSVARTTLTSFSVLTCHPRH